MNEITYKVKSAVWGWNVSGTNSGYGIDVTQVLQNLLPPSDAGNFRVVPINVETFTDPSPGNNKSFAAVLTISDSSQNLSATVFVTVPQGTNLRFDFEIGIPVNF